MMKPPMKAVRKIPIIVAVVLLLAVSTRAANPPNVVWILSEDNSKHFLKLFDPAGAPTPNIKRLAANGLVFDRAFSNSPVCSVARTTLMTGVYAPRLGTQFHRKLEPATLPEGWNLFPAYLRKAGYHTSNNSKTDYNTANHRDVWNESSNRASWRDRPSPSTPFFHMRTFGQSHEGSLHFPRDEMNSQPTGTSPADVDLADYHPDTPLFRYTYARYHDRIRLIDAKVGELVAQLEEDGLLENTFIFYFGDHGGVLPGSKGYLRETGLHVPLVVRVPEQWRDRIGIERGGRTDGFVEFVDFGPTVLKLAGVDVPAHMDGRPFLGDADFMATARQRNEAFGYADRFDEKYEMVRSLRRGDFKYVRNFEGHLPDGLQNNYRYLNAAFREWRELFHAGRLNAAQSAFLKRKPAEQLFNLTVDPYETRNLAADPDHRERLVSMRNRLAAWQRELPDLSFFPESVLVESALRSPIEFGREHIAEIAELQTVANLAVQPFADARPALLDALRSDQRWKRYHAATVCAVFGKEAADLTHAVRPLLRDPEPLVRVRAAEFLGGLGVMDPAPTLLTVLRESGSPVVSLIALNAVVYLRDGEHAWPFDVKPADVPAKNPEVLRRLEYLAAGRTSD